MTHNPRAAFQQYRRRQIAELRPWVDGDPTTGISVSAEDRKAGSPKPGDMIARNPKNHADQWLVAEAYFADNFEPLTASPGEQQPVAFMFWNDPDTQRHFTQLRETIGTHWRNVTPLYTSPPPAVGCPDWGQIVQSLLRSMDHPFKGESSSEQAERMADDLCKKYPALRREAPASSGVVSVELLNIERATGDRLRSENDKLRATIASLSPSTSRPDDGGGVRADERERLIAFADYYLANNAAENGTDELIRQLRDALATQPITEPIYKAVERILDEKSAWIARPNDEVTKSIAIQAVAAAHKIIAESCSICGGVEYPVESALSNPPSPVESNGSVEAKSALSWAVGRWNAEVLNRPLQNKHRRSLDTTWRQVISHFGGDDVELCGPRHDELVEAHQPAESGDRQ